MSCSTYLVLSLFFSISLWLPRVWTYSRAKCFYSHRRTRRFSLSNVCMSCMYVSSLGRRQTADFILSPKLPFLRLREGLCGVRAHIRALIRPLSVVLKRRREGQESADCSGDCLPRGLPSSKRGHEFGSGPCVLLCD